MSAQETVGCPFCLAKPEESCAAPEPGPCYYSSDDYDYVPDYDEDFEDVDYDEWQEEDDYYDE